LGKERIPLASTGCNQKTIPFSKGDTHDHDELFLPFRDATSGNETYGAGRYLEPEELSGNEILVDFNLAYNPL